MKLKVSKCFVFVDLFFVDASRWEQGAIWGSDAPFTLWLARSNFKFVPANCGLHLSTWVCFKS